MDIGQVGHLGTCAAPHAATARGLRVGPVLIQPLPRVVNHVRGVVQIPGFAIYVSVQVVIVITIFEEMHVKKQ